MAGRPWTREEEADLRELYPDRGGEEVAAMLNERHGNGRTCNAVRVRAAGLGLRKGDGYRRPRRRTFWDEGRRAWFRSYVPGHTEAEISAEHERVFGSPLTRGQIKGAKKALGVRSGTHGGRWEKGHVPANKGKSWAEQGISEDAQARMRRTCFKVGEVPDRRDGWVKPIGHERVNVDGYVEVKVRDSRESGVQPKGPGMHNYNYRFKHHIVYEQAYGSIPGGCSIVFANHDKRDFRPENLVAVPRAIWATIVRRRMAYHDADSLRACMAVAGLRRGIRKARLAPRECSRCGETFEPRNERQRTCDACLGREESKR